MWSVQCVIYKYYQTVPVLKTIQKYTILSKASNCRYMGAVDCERQKLNVFRMKVLGAKVPG